MQVIHGYQAWLQSTAQRGSAVGIGIFDGVHAGHQVLLSRVLELAQAHGLMPVAYTFDPHPAEIFQPKLAPKLIEPLSMRLKRLDDLGIECAIVEPFNRTFAALSAQEYIENILVKTLHAQHVVVGQGFVFGNKQQGHVQTLKDIGQQEGFATHPIDHVRIDGIEVSSTKVRNFVQAGQLAGANLLLKRPFALRGKVVHGAQRGQSLVGFATANLNAENALLPAIGVYAAHTQTARGQHAAVVNIGRNPTFGHSDAIKIEAHLLDYQGPSFYDSTMLIHLHERIRDEKKFSDAQALGGQIQQDIADARRILKSIHVT